MREIEVRSEYDLQAERNAETLILQRRIPVFCEMTGQICILRSAKLFQIDGEMAM